jgi:hypothetical protein
MVLFSERYGYTKPAEVLIREEITEEIENALCSCYDMLEDYVRKHLAYKDETYKEMELFLWTNFLNKRRNDFYSDFGFHKTVATNVLKEKKFPWYQKLNMVEMSVKWLYERSENYQRLVSALQSFTALINHEFERLNYAYRFVDKEIVEITSKEEIVSIEQAIKGSENNVKLHLQTALGLLAKKPSGDYRNSIKESISAVEAVCRELTAKSTLGDALNELEKAGVVIPKVMKLGFDKLYGYTNNKETGIRHALMDNDGSYIPSSDEAVFMLVSCSAFINYLYAKRAK